MMLTRTHVSALVALSVLYWVLVLLVRGVPVGPEMLMPFGAVVGAVSVTLLVFDRWLWHWPIFRGWLINRPFLRGTWRAELISGWIDPTTGKATPPIHAFMVVRQTASTLSFRLITQESRSETVSAGVEPCKDGAFEITCAYRNKPKATYRHRSEVHYGAMLLEADTASPVRLEGEYWTDRKTTGTVSLTDRRKTICMTIEEAEHVFS